MAESFIKIMRINEMITTQRSFDCSTNSPCQYQRKCTERGMENIDTDVRVYMVKGLSACILKLQGHGITYMTLQHPT